MRRHPAIDSRGSIRCRYRCWWPVASGRSPRPFAVAKCYHQGMPVNMHIRDLDESTHRELVRRADATGMSLRSYVIEVLHRLAALPTLDEWWTRCGPTRRCQARDPTA
jgi:hypothetical protein